MAGVRFTELQSRPLEFLDCTSLTLEEFQQLVPPFETAFHARMTAWRMDGTPRTARRFSVDKNCPLLTPEDRLLFILVYLKTWSCTRPLRIIIAPRKPGTIPSFHHHLRGHCHGTNPLFLPARTRCTGVVLPHALLAVVQRRRCPSPADRAIQATPTPPL